VGEGVGERVGVRCSGRGGESKRGREGSGGERGGRTGGVHPCIP
jgi:hypothetical protein